MVVLVIKRFFVFLLILSCFVLPAFASESDDSYSVSDMMDGVFDLVGQVVSSVESDVIDYSPESDSSSDFSSNLGSSSNNLLVVNTPTYSTSDLATAFYKALIEAEAQRVDEYSTISNIDIAPLYTPDTGVTTVPTGSLRYVLNQLIGPYSPVVVQYQYSSGSNVAYVREIMPDYQWMISAAIFALVLYCVFRLWGVILCRR